MLTYKNVEKNVSKTLYNEKLFLNVTQKHKVWDYEWVGL